MRILVSVIIFACLNTNVFCKEKPSYAEEIKNSKTIIGLKEYPKDASREEKEHIDSLNYILKFAVKNYWNYTEIADSMPLSEAKKYVKKNNGYSVASYGQGSSVSANYSGGYRYVAVSETFQLYIPGWNVPTYLPYFPEDMFLETMVFSVMKLQSQLEQKLSGELDKYKNLIKYYEAKSPQIIKKTLLIPEEYLSPELSESDIKLLYPFDYDICDLEKLSKAIIGKDSKYVIITFVPEPMNGDFSYKLYVSGTEDGFVYGVDWGKTFNFSVSGKNLTNRKYVITERELKVLSEMVD